MKTGLYPKDYGKPGPPIHKPLGLPVFSSAHHTRTSITADTPTPCTRENEVGFTLSIGMSPLIRNSLSFQLISSYPTAFTFST